MKTSFYPYLLDLRQNYCEFSGQFVMLQDDFSIYQSKIMTICLASLIIVTHPEHSQYSISKCSPPLYSSLVIICTLYCITINSGPN